MGNRVLYINVIRAIGVMLTSIASVATSYFARQNRRRRY